MSSAIRQIYGGLWARVYTDEHRGKDDDNGSRFSMASVCMVLIYHCVVERATKHPSPERPRTWLNLSFASCAWKTYLVYIHTSIARATGGTRHMISRRSMALPWDNMLSTEKYTCFTHRLLGIYTSSYSTVLRQYLHIQEALLIATYYYYTPGYPEELTGTFSLPNVLSATKTQGYSIF